VLAERPLSIHTASRKRETAGSAESADVAVVAIAAANLDNAS